jgi:hypothetical protein
MLKLTVLALACLVAGPLALAEIPRFAEPVLIQDGGVPIDVGYYAAPMMFDWDLDGRKDMVVGQFTSGMIRFYPNVGDDSAPVFSGFSYLEASGVTITLPSG